MKEKKLAAFRNTSIGFVFQFHQLLPEFSAVENIIIPALIGNRKESEARDTAMELLEMLGLKGRETHKPAELSGGEQQRVAIARALINSPKILFADEATANLDTVSSEVVYRLFQKLNKELNQTIIMITHEPEDRKYMDRVIWLKDGLIEKED